MSTNTGMAQFVSSFSEPTDPEYAPPVEKGETPKARIHQLRLEEGAKKAAEELEKYDPNSDPNISGDPYKTLFVANLNYETTESRIKREFEAYGPIKRVRLIADKETNKPRGYAFIEYMHTRDMKAAYKQADGRKIDNRRVLVDVERGRTVPNWRPRRLGGGLGTSRVGGEEVNQKNSGREQQQSGGATRSVEPMKNENTGRSHVNGLRRGNVRSLVKGFTIDQGTGSTGKIGTIGTVTESHTVVTGTEIVAGMIVTDIATETVVDVIVIATVRRTGRVMLNT